MRSLVVSAMALMALGAAATLPSPAAARLVGIGSGAPGWAFYAPTPYFAYPIDLSYHTRAYPDGFFIGGSFGGHSLHHWW